MIVRSIFVVACVALFHFNSAEAAPMCCTNIWDSQSGSMTCVQAPPSNSVCADGMVSGRCNGYQGSCSPVGGGTPPSADEPAPCGNFGQPPCQVPMKEAVESENYRDNFNFYGFRGGVNQSGSGRSNHAAKAMLDTCFVGGSGQAGWQVVDSISNLTSCYTACDNSTTNVACFGTFGGTVPCYTRCEGVFQ